MKNFFRLPVQYYNKIANAYEGTAEVCRRNYKKIHQFVSASFPQISGKLLDVGCGTGLSSVPFARPDLEIYGVDGSYKMLEIFAGKNVMRGFQILDLEQDSLDFPERTFDIVISDGVFCLFSNLDRLMGEIGKVAKEGGIFCFTVEDINKVEPFKTVRSGLEIFRHNFCYLNQVLKINGFQFLKQENYISYFNPFSVGSAIFTVILCQKIK